jgi:RNA polymerase sigma-70 factor (ECF subfamily)
MRRGTEENERLRRHIYKECVSHKVEHVREQIIALLPRLRRFARTMTRNVHDADDLVQTAIERALARFEQLRPNSSIAGWMFGIMRNAWIDEVRASVRRDRVLAPEEAGENIGDPKAELQLDVLSVEGAMARLPDEQRHAIGLVLIEGLSYKEAAEIMDVPIGTLTSRLARGREALQRMLSGAAGEAR